MFKENKITIIYKHEKPDKLLNTRFGLITYKIFLDKIRKEMFAHDIDTYIDTKRINSKTKLIGLKRIGGYDGDETSIIR